MPQIQYPCPVNDFGNTVLRDDNSLRITVAHEVRGQPRPLSRELRANIPSENGLLAITFIAFEHSTDIPNKTKHNNEPIFMWHTLEVFTGPLSFSSKADVI
ncbi:hypothetical protein TWF132_008082 [Orbilia oligospora]|nr:hypothetical protein TWF132_008082 [Orbilia oligospora]